MKAFWYGGRNWGDQLTPALAARCGVKLTRSLGSGRVLGVGSIVHRLRPGDVVWGSGAISPRHVPDPLPPGVTFLATRGPLTRQALVRRGADVPEVYGDPALLVPELFGRPAVEPRWEVGYLPHYADAGLVGVPAGVPVIDVLCDDVEALISEVLACRRIVSSSLHGLILAEAYGLPAAWLQVDDGQRLVGGGFKFADYLASTAREAEPMRIRGGERLDPARLPWLPPPCIDLDGLRGAWPFGGTYPRPE
jgi:pyruvyltransferase